MLTSLALVASLLAPAFDPTYGLGGSLETPDFVRIAFGDSGELRLLARTGEDEARLMAFDAEGRPEAGFGEGGTVVLKVADCVLTLFASTRDGYTYGYCYSLRDAEGRFVRFDRAGKPEYGDEVVDLCSVFAHGMSENSGLGVVQAAYLRLPDGAYAEINGFLQWRPGAPTRHTLLDGPLRDVQLISAWLSPSGEIVGRDIAGRVFDREKELDLDLAEGTGVNIKAHLGSALFVQVGANRFARFDAVTGARDRTFGDAGWINPPQGFSRHAEKVLADGGCLVIWRRNSTDRGALVAARYDARGKLVTSFGQGGLLPVVDDNKFVDVLALDAQDRLLVGTRGFSGPVVIRRYIP